MFNQLQSSRLLPRLGLIGVLVCAGLFLTVALAQAAWPVAETRRAPLVDETCFATPNNGVWVYSSTTAQAVREAVVLASLTMPVKIAGYCPGVVFQGGMSQTVLITQSLTLAGGYTITDWTTYNPTANPTTLDAQGQGRVISITNVGVTLQGFTVTNGYISTTLNWSGGGIAAAGALTLTDMTVYSNTITGITGTQHGGGGYINGGAIISNTTFRANQARNNGGGVWVLNSASLISTTFINNAATVGGGGYFNATASLTSSNFLSNTGGDGGGAYFNAATVITNTTFTGNTAIGQAGGAVFGSLININNSAFINNTANIAGAVWFSNPNAKQLVNVLFAGNHAPNGATIYVNNAAPLQLIHVTIVTPTVPTNTIGVYVANGTVYLTNTLIASQTVGLQRAGGTVTEWNTLYSGVTVPQSGTITSIGAITGTALFVNPGADNYHLSPGSLGIDAGTTPSPNVTTDFDGDARPMGSGYDIGYDETTTASVPPSQISLSGPTTALVSTTVNVTATLTPITASTPLTYRWSAFEQTPVTHTNGLTVTDMMTYVWSTPGVKLITVTASNLSGSVTTTYAITLTSAISPSQVNLSHAASGVVSDALTFTGTVLPLTVTTPLTYVWTATDQATFTQTNSLTTTTALSYTWNVTGTQWVTLTATGLGGMAFTTTSVIISPANHLQGVVFNDLNGNSLLEAGEPGLANVVVTLSNGTSQTTTTAATGAYHFYNLAAGTYTVVESDPAGYSSLTPNAVVVPISANGDFAVNFADQPTGLVSGAVFNDPNGNGVQDNDEVGIPNVLITLSNGSTQTTTTNSSGVYSFTGVLSGTHTVLETDPAGYVSTSPNYRVVIVAPGGSASASFGEQLAGTVSGVVFGDDNGNGMQDAGEGGLVGVTVSLIDGVTLSTTTDAFGAYIFSGVTPDAYLVRETDPAGFVSTNANVQAVSVAAGGSATANFGDLPASMVRGGVFNDLNGNGQWEAGEPGLGGVTVALIGGSTLTTTTANDGSYTFGSVAAGAYTLRETDPLGFVSTSDNAVAVLVGAGGSATANFGDQPASTLSGQVFNDLDANGLLGEGEFGMGNLTVTLTLNGGSLVSTRTSADGRYAFSNLIAGEYQACLAVPTDLVPTLPACREMTLAAGGSGAANFGLMAASNIGGAVFVDDNGNGQRDLTEAGLGGVGLELRQGGSAITTSTSGNGLFAFNFVAAGAYQLCAVPPAGFAETTRLCEQVLLQAGSSVAASFGFVEQGALQGVVFNDVNGNGQPDFAEVGLGGVTVRLLDKDGAFITTTTTSGDGAYRFGNLTPGRYIVEEINPTDFRSTSQDQVSARLQNNGSEVVNFGDQRLGTVSGVVYEDLNGNNLQDYGEPGIGGATIVLSGTASLFTVTTAADGSYTFFGVVGGDYQVLGTPPDGCFAVTPGIIHVSVSPNGSGQANFGQLRLATVNGVVFYDINGDGAQQPGEPGLGGVAVELWRGGAKELTATTNANGQYVFVNLLPGGYMLIENNPTGYASTTPDEVFIHMGSTRAATVNFGDWKAGLLNGLVFDDVNGNGLPEVGELGLGGVTVTLTTLTGTLTTATSGDGRYQFSVTPGFYSVTETDPEGYVSTTPNVRSVIVPATGSASADFGDMATGLVTGLVFNDLNGNGVRDLGEWGLGDVTIELNGATVVTTTTTTGDGVFIFRQVVSGTYAVIETDPTGYASTTPNHRLIALAQGGSTAVEFGDRPRGSLSGVVFDDRNGNGRQDADELGLGGVTISLSGGSTLTTTTTGNGSYQFLGLATGAYAVAQTDLPGYFSTTPNAYEVFIAASGSANANFGDRPGGFVSGLVFNDLNGNGQRDDGELGLGGVTVQLISGGTRATTTLGDGSYQFSDVAPGPYVVLAEDLSGYVSTSPNAVDIAVPTGGGATANFADQQTGTVSGEVWVDTNGDGRRDPAETGLGGVAVQLSGPTTAWAETTGDGAFFFTNVVPGLYVAQVTPPAGLAPTTPARYDLVLGSGGSASAGFGFQRLGSIVGVVFMDLNGNGLRDTDEPGLGNVALSLLNSAGVVTRTAQTAGNGAYEFRDLVADRYLVREVDPIGFASITPNTAVVGLADGGSFNVDFGDLALGTLGGVVFNDANGDGVLSWGESGLSGITVTLYQNGGPVAQTLTSGNGRFAFADLLPGTYTVVETDPSGFMSSSPNQVTLRVSTGGSIGASFGDFVPGQVFGLVFMDLNGDAVSTISEIGLGNITITLHNLTSGVSVTQQTNSQGQYAFRDLGPGLYRIEETDPPGAVSTTPNQVTLNLTLAGNQAVNFGDAISGTVSGQVTAMVGWLGALPSWASAFPNANVLLRDVTVELWNANRSTILSTTTTASDGIYRFGNLSPGQYQVRAKKPPYGNVGSWYYSREFAPIALLNSAIVNHRFQYDPCVLGVVYLDANRNSLQDAGEALLSGVQVQLVNGSGTVVSETVSAGNGLYLFLDVPTGTYRVTLTPPTGWAVGTENPVAVALVDPEQGENISFGLVPTSGVGGAALTGGLRGPTAPTAGTGVVQGQIVDAQGLGLSGLTVQFTDAAGTPLGQTTTLADGSYYAANVPVGAVTVRASTPAGYVSLTSDLSTVVVNEGQSAVANFVDVPEAAAIRGVVFSDDNGNSLRENGEAGLGGLTVMLQQGGSTLATATTTASGDYAFALVSGPYQVVAMLPSGYISTTLNPAVGWGAAILDFGARSANLQAAITGRVFNDADGNGQQAATERPIGAATVSLLAQNGALVTTTITTGDGQYTFANLTAAAYQVVVTPANGFLATTAPTLTVWATNESAAFAAFGWRYVGSSSGRGTVVGRVFQDWSGDYGFTPHEPPLVGATVRVWSGATLITETQTLGDGAYWFDLATGNYVVELVIPTGFTTTTYARWPIALAEGQVTSLPFGVRPLTTLSGAAFLDADGDGRFGMWEHGVGGLTVTLSAADGTPLSTTVTSVAGYYAFHLVTPGTYTLTLTLPTGLVTTTALAQAVNLAAPYAAAANFGLHLNGVVGGAVYFDVNGTNRFNAGELGLSGVAVTLTRAAQTRVFTTNPQGQYQFLDLLAGVYTVTTAAPVGFATLTDTWVLTLTGSGFANFAAFPTNTIAGQVYFDPNRSQTPGRGEPGFGGVVVQLQDANGNTHTTQARGDGTYEFRNLAAGTYTVTVAEPSGFDLTTPLLVTATLNTSTAPVADFGLWDPNTPTAVEWTAFSAAPRAGMPVGVWLLAGGLTLLVLGFGLRWGGAQRLITALGARHAAARAVNVWSHWLRRRP